VEPPALVLITGSGPGLGKSTLARTLADGLRLAGYEVALFAEEEIETNPAFAWVMEEFQSSGRVELPALLKASSKYLGSLDERHVEVAILDALFAFLPSLLAWGHTDHEIAEFFQHMARLFSERPVLEIHLIGDLVDGLARAGAREGNDWLDRHVLKVSTYEGAPRVSDIRDAASYLEDLEHRSVSLLHNAPWRVEFLDVDSGFASVASEAAAIVESLLKSS